jgi:hypothetical protein
MADRKDSSAEQVTEQKLPKELRITLDGQRSMLKLVAELPNALTGDGKLDRNSIFTIGRSAEVVNQYTIEADGEVVAIITRDDKNWNVSYIESGKEKSSQKVGRTETKRPRRAGSHAPIVIDSGPDLYKVITHMAHSLWPDMKGTSRGGTGTRPATLREKVERQDREKRQLLEALASARGKTVDEIAEELGVTL